MKTINVLVTDVTGVIARQLVENLIHDRNVGLIIGVSTEEMPYYLQDLDPTRFFYKRVDIMRERQLNNMFLSEFFREARINAVAHCTIMNRPSISGRQLPLIDGTKLLLKRCVESGYITKFVYLSSYQVYRLQPQTSVMIDEDADLNFDANATDHVRDLVDVDMLCRTKMDTPGLRIIVLRPGPIVGRNERSPFNILLESLFPFLLLGFNPIINPIHDRDVVGALQIALHKQIQGVFNVAGKEFAPVSEFVAMAGRRPTFLPEFVLKRIYDLQHKLGLTKLNYVNVADLLRYGCVLDTRKAQKQLEFLPTYHVKFNK